MPYTSSITLPLELWESIIDILPLDTYEGQYSLCNCLLVSKGFFLRSRSRLFARADLRPSYGRRLKAFRKLLEFKGNVEGGLAGYPSLIGSVKSVKIVWPYQAFHQLGVESATVVGLVYGDDIVAILLILAENQMVGELELYFLRTTTFAEIQTSSGVHQALRAIIDSPSFEKLSIDSLHDVPFQVFNIWRIKELDISNVTFLEANPEATSLEPCTTLLSKDEPQLRAFIYMLGNPLHSMWLCSPSLFSDLHTLTLNFDFNPSLSEVESNILLNALLVISHTLHTLDFRMDYPETVLETFSPSLNHLNALHQLRFTILAVGEMNADQPSLIFEQTPEDVRTLEAKAGSSHSCPGGYLLVCFSRNQHAVQIQV
ncbi:hypothetical protein CPB83DRAFT_865357 [Crepidotus variabilis]|uniref:F-box domain-containing protein n=1 Tax=Crepidotus variabilis TaxID=179855 RepID=A0A9P6E371_9AGAR|nr:hypothetical protein CPB83DRAFT_865357 [Crepidotus variabilis]